MTRFATNMGAVMELQEKNVRISSPYGVYAGPTLQQRAAELRRRATDLMIRLNRAGPLEPVSQEHQTEMKAILQDMAKLELQSGWNPKA